jgi:hypothetical protein
MRRLAMPRLARFLKLSTADKLLLLYCGLVVATIRIGLSLFSYRTLRHRLRQSVVVPAATDHEARRIIWAVTTSARIVPRASCLTQALAAQFLLARAGCQSVMRVGVATDAKGQLIAHVWLIRAGRVVMGGSDREVQRYTTLTDLSLGPQ